MPKRVDLSVCSYILNRATLLNKPCWRNAERETRELMTACFDDFDLTPPTFRAKLSQLAADFKLIFRNNARCRQYDVKVCREPPEPTTPCSSREVTKDIYHLDLANLTPQKEAP